MKTPSRLYYFSDAYGGHDEQNPLSQPDADVLISTDYGSAINRPRQREFDILGNEQVTDHILRLLLQQHDEYSRRNDLDASAKQSFIDAGTGVFINAAPRVNRSNAEPFYLATLRGGAIRVVATPLHALSAVRDHVETLAHLPNPQSEKESNGLYSHREQFRSRLTPTLLQENKRLALQKDNPDIIPAYDKGWHVAYVDRFGNIVTWVKDVERQWEEIQRVGQGIGGTREHVQLTVGYPKAEASQHVQLGTSLGSAEPGAVSVYKNGNIDIVRKWKAGEGIREKLRNSAFRLFGSPQIGDPLKVDRA